MADQQQVMVRFALDGETYQFDNLHLAEARLVKKWTGFTPASFGEALFNLDPDALTALILITRKRRGEYVAPNAFDQCDADLGSLEVSFVDGKGRRVEPKVDAAGEPVLDAAGKPIILYDGEPESDAEPADPTAAGGASGSGVVDMNRTTKKRTG